MVTVGLWDSASITEPRGMSTNCSSFALASLVVIRWVHGVVFVHVFKVCKTFSNFFSLTEST